MWTILNYKHFPKTSFLKKKGICASPNIMIGMTELYFTAELEEMANEDQHHKFQILGKGDQV